MSGQVANELIQVKEQTLEVGQVIKQSQQESQVAELKSHIHKLQHQFANTLIELNACKEELSKANTELNALRSLSDTMRISYEKFF